MLNSESIYGNIIIFMIAMGCMGLSNPSSDALSSRYVENEHRGRFNSFYNISKILGTVLASCLVAWGVVSDNNLVSTIRIIITAVYLFAKNKILISFNKTLSDNFEKVYETSIQTSIQNIINDVLKIIKKRIG